MSIDPKKALGAELGTTEGSWSRDDVILYHLGIGAGAGAGKATDARELEYTYEKNLKVLPSFGVIPVFDAVMQMNSVPGIDINFAMVLHGEQELEIHKPLPTSAEVVNTGRIAGIYDKGKAALVVIEAVTTEKGGDKLCTNRFSVFARGEGGFGGESGPKAGNVAPDREPDLVVESPTTAHQALLYRLSGDKNPLHADPEFAKMGGFETPILHGLCSFGVVCKAVVDSALDGDVSKVAGYSTRFAGVVYPGETIRTSMWREDGQILISAKSVERDSPVMTNASIKIR
jgi:acyl dehydratase